jgi:hypothetical protein
VSCVTWTPNGIYVCTSQQQKGFALGFAPDLATLERDELTPLLDLTTVEGPLSCPAETSTSTCGVEWESTCEDLGACGNDSGAGGDGGADAVGQGGSNEGSGGSEAPPSSGQPSSTGGSSSSGGSATAGDTPAEQRRDDSGCGCRIASAPLEYGATLSALAALLLLMRRRGH